MDREFDDRYSTDRLRLRENNRLHSFVSRSVDLEYHRGHQYEPIRLASSLLAHTHALLLSTCQLHESRELRNRDTIHAMSSSILTFIDPHCLRDPSADVRDIATLYDYTIQLHLSSALAL